MTVPPKPQPPTPDASSSANSIAQSLALGLSLLQQRRYDEAIAPLTAAATAADDRAAGLSAQTALIKAQMALVKAYDRTDQGDLALALCDRLETYPQPDIQQWASQTRAVLLAKFPSTPPTPLAVDAAGEVPDVPPAAGAVTGFVPLNPSPATATGFVPLSSAPAANSPASHQVTDQPVPPTQAAAIAHAIQAETTAAAVNTEEMETTSETEAIAAPPPPYTPTWRNAERAKRWQPLPRIWQVPYWLWMGATAAISLGGVRLLLITGLRHLNRLIAKIDWPINLTQVSWLDHDPFWLIVIYFLGLAAIAPWLWDWLVTWRYGARSLDWETLKTHSEEAVRVIQRLTRQYQWSPPQLYYLATPAPIIFSYGYPPRFTRIVISQGLLTQLTADEIAVLCARELAQLRQGDGILLSGLMVAAQVPYQLYLVVADWGDRQQHVLWQKGATLLAAIAYGGYSLVRWLGLGLARHRVWHSDRAAVGITGNPNGLIRAVLKLAIGTAQTIERDGHTSPLLESSDSLMPLGYRSSLTVGSLFAHVPIAHLLQWETQHPHRAWLAINNPQPPLGDRLYRLCRYASQWHLAAELPPALAAPLPPPQTFAQWWERWQPLWFQASPWTGAGVGVAIALGLRLFGQIADAVGVYELYWLVRERDLWLSGLLIGGGVGTWLRINALFPDLTPGMIDDRAAIAPLVQDPEALPIYPQGVQLRGKLLGRTGIKNALGQDLILQTTLGLLKLHYTFVFGPVGNLFFQASTLRPEVLIGRQVDVVGWFRRGVNPWLDVAWLRSQTRQTVRANPPIGETVLGAIAIFWGLILLYSN